MQIGDFCVDCNPCIKCGGLLESVYIGSYYFCNKCTTRFELDELLKNYKRCLCRVKCECGAEKTNTLHSHWCPKYRKVNV